ncbi:MAG: U2 snRNP complex subunit msl1 [Sclerophora amabilis]|nr:MAG: U2 snRNP complex subunit msl1 [Sclerophora amabilis]
MATTMTMTSRTAATTTTTTGGKSLRSSTPPNQTLYVTNLNDKLRKEDLRLSLYTLFSTYGPVLDVVALKTMKMRGQAHVVYRDVQASTQAMRALQGFEFFGKEMKIDYAKTKSDTVSKLDGTFRMPAAAAGAVTATELQQSIFNAPPSSITAGATTASTTTTGTGLKPPEAGAAEKDGAEDGAKSPQGMKRRRDDESDDEGAPMDEDDEDDEDVQMEVSSDED